MVVEKITHRDTLNMRGRLCGSIMVCVSCSLAKETAK
jgi:hypothetical protein